MHKLRLLLVYCKDLLNRLKVKYMKNNKKFAFPMHEEQVLVDFHSVLIDNPSTLDAFAFEETYTKVKFINLERRLRKRLPQYREIDGSYNVWIVKPSYNARGLGIYCTRQVNQIIQVSKKLQHQQKVVQKYIENPMCIKGKKFDFR